jgi:hypothetical protein
VKVKYELKAGVTRVETSVSGSDNLLVITDQAKGPYETSDPAEIDALDQLEGLKRVEGKAPVDKPQPPTESAAK